MRTLYCNGKIWTGEGIFAEAFLVEDGVFRAVGSGEQLAGLPADRRVDLGGRFVCPGFHDSHMHLLGYGQLLGEADLSAHTGSLAEVLDCLRERLRTDPPAPGTWLLGRGWNQDYFSDADRMPDRHDLDAVSRETPILITRCCGHCCVSNTRALELAGIDASTAAPEGGAIGREGGVPDGRFYDNAMELIESALPVPDRAALRELVLRACRALNSYGITGVQSDDYCVFRAVPWETVNGVFRELAAEGRLSVRVYEQCNFTSLPELERFLDAGNRTGLGDDRFRIGPLKLLGDGALGSRTAHLSRPYRGGAGERGFSLFSEPELRAMISLAHRRGMQIAVHAIGDACLDRVLDAFESALRECPGADCRHGIVHCQVSRPEQLRRIRELGLQVYAQTVFLDYDNHIVPRLLPPELAESSYRWKTLLRSGVRISNGSDCPVEAPDVMKGIQCAVTRRSLDGAGPLHPEEAFTLDEALESYTVRSAEACFQEHRRGAIRPGLLADFTLLDADPFSVPPEELHRIRAAETYLGGARVWPD